MLKKIILILTDTYGKKLEISAGYSFWVNRIREYGCEVALYKISQVKSGKNEIIHTLYLSDDADTLARLQRQGCYTVAVYHEGVTGLLSGTQFAAEGIEDVEWEYLYKVYQRFAGQPWEITQTKRCKIREMAAADVDDLYELYDNPNVTRYTEKLFSKKEQEVQYMKDYIENVYAYYGYGIWLIHKKEDGKLIGRAGFAHRPGFEEPELGFVIGESFWKRGYAYEVCSHLLRLGKSVYEFDRVQAFVKEENIASIHLLEKLGFLYEEDIFMEGEEYRRYVTELAI